MFRLHRAFGIVMAGLAIVLLTESRAQAFGYAMWSVWFFQMAHGRLQVRERGILVNGFLTWKRITRCVATADNMVRLHLSNGFQRVVDLKLPADRREEFIGLVSRRAGTQC